MKMKMKYTWLGIKMCGAALACIWASFWLWQFLEGSYQKWWAAPYFVTVVLVTFIAVNYVVECDEL